MSRVFKCLVVWGLIWRRDFLVNMAGCEWGRDCWGEMYNFRQLSNHLNRSHWDKFRDAIRDYFKKKNEVKQ